MPSPRKREIRAALLGPSAILLVLCALLRVVSLFRPCLSDDEAIYAVVAREMLGGRVLYDGVVDHKPPAIYLFYEAAQAIGGPTAGMILLHALAIVFVWLTGLLLAGIVRRHAANPDPRAPFMAALLWILFSSFYFDVDSLAVNCELPMMLAVVASVAVFLGARGRLTWLALAGLLAGVATLFKYQAGVQLVLFGGAWILAERTRPTRVAAGLAALTVSAAAPAVLAVGLLHRAGALDAAWFWFRFNFAYVQTGFASVDVLGRMLVSLGAVVAPGFLLYSLGVWEAIAGIRRGPELRRFAATWLILSALAVCVGGRFFGHYFHQIAAPLVLLAAAPAVKLLVRRPTWFAVGTVVPAATFLVLGILHTSVMKAVGDPDPDYAQVSDWLDAHAPKDQALCVWGNSPVLYFLAERPLGCRFVFANYLTGLSPATKTQTDPTVDAARNIVPEAWDMLVADLAARRPMFIVDASPGDVAHYGKFPPARFARLQTVLDAEFTPAAEIAGMRIWRRRLPSP